MLEMFCGLYQANFSTAGISTNREHIKYVNSLIAGPLSPKILMQ